MRRFDAPENPAADKSAANYRQQPKSEDFRRFARLLVVCVLLALVCGVNPSPCHAQVIDEGSFDAQLDDVFLMPDRRQLQLMRQAESFIEEGQYSNAARALARILETDSDFFIRKPGSETFASFKRKAERMIGEFPKEGLEAYDTLFGAIAERELENAVQSSAIEHLIECSRRYFHTEAGAQATWMLGLYYLDRGQPLTTATLFQRLQENAKAAELEPKLSLLTAIAFYRAGREEDARSVAIKMRQEFANARFELGGQSLPIFADDRNALAWLAGIGGAAISAEAQAVAGWLLPRGSASGQAIVNADRPISVPRWRLPTSTDEDTQSKIRKLETEFASENPPIVAMPASQPLAIGDYVIVRTKDALVAVDFETGKRTFPLSMLPPPAVPGMGETRFGESQASLDLLELERNLVDDLSDALVSSDGRNVYFVADQSQHRSQHQIFLPADGASPYGPLNDVNWLEARSLESEGKLLWTLGGPETAGNPLAGAYFLGPPLPLHGVLYCLVEWNKAIELVAVQPGQGASEVSVVWRQHLAAVQEAYGYDVFRRMVGATPSFADGFLVCPTSSGAVVAVDLSTKSLQWGFKYAQNDPIYASRAQQLHSGRAGNRFDRWVDGTSVIANGKVYLTPPFAHRMYCLDLVTGELLWDVARNRGLYLAAATERHVFVVGSDQIDVFDVETGAQSAELPLPSGVTPSGRGIRTPDTYLLPLNSGEIALVNLKQLQIDQRVTLQGIPGAERPTLGNLVAHRGSIISQSLHGVDCFYQIGELKEQIQGSDQGASNAEVLTNQALVLLEENDRKAAIPLLQQSLKLRKDELTRILLVSNLRAILREDFSSNRELNDEIKDLLVTVEERTSFLHDVAHGLYTTGEYRAAFEVYLELADLVASSAKPHSVAMMTPAKEWKVRESRYLGARLMNLYQLADSADQAFMDEQIAQRLPAIPNESTADRAALRSSAQQLRQFIDNFLNHQAANTARIRLARTLQAIEPGSFETELLLRQAWRTGDVQQQSQAISALTECYLQGGNIAAARDTNQLYAEHIAKHELAAVGEAKNLSQRIQLAIAENANLSAWGKWDQQEPQEQNPGPMSLLVPLANDGSLAEVSTRSNHSNIYWDTNNAGHLQGQDALGNTAWTLPVDAAIGTRRYVAATAYRFQSLGQLQLVTLGERLLSIGVRDRTAKTLGEMTFASSFSGTGIGEIRTNSFRHPWGEMRDSLLDLRNRNLGVTALLNEECLCIVQGQDIIAVHPTLQGEILWRRRVEKNVERMFGSGERLFAVHDETATVLRAADGEILGERDVPPNIEIMSGSGDGVVHWLDAWPIGGREQTVLSLADCWLGTKDNPVNLWQREFEANAKGYRISRNRAAIVEPGGTLSVLDLKNGVSELELELNPDENLSTVFAMEHGDTLIVVANSAENFEQARGVITPFPAAIGGVRVNGWVYAIDLQKGTKLWEQKLGNHGVWLEQPAGLPVLVFACAANIRRNGKQIRANSVLILDKQTGETIHSTESSLSTASNYTISGNPETGTVEFEWPNTTRLIMNFDKPDSDADQEERN